MLGVTNDSASEEKVITEQTRLGRRRKEFERHFEIFVGIGNAGYFGRDLALPPAQERSKSIQNVFLGTQ